MLDVVAVGTSAGGVLLLDVRADKIVSRFGFGSGRTGTAKTGSEVNSVTSGGASITALSFCTAKMGENLLLSAAANGVLALWDLAARELRLEWRLDDNESGNGSSSNSDAKTGQGQADNGAPDVNGVCVAAGSGVKLSAAAARLPGCAAVPHV